jgi:hypothetical protein
VRELPDRLRQICIVENALHPKTVYGISSPITATARRSSGSGWLIEESPLESSATYDSVLNNSVDIEVSVVAERPALPAARFGNQ